MRSQRYYKVIYPVAGVIRRQYDSLILPIVLLGVSITAMLAYLTTKRNVNMYHESL